MDERTDDESHQYRPSIESQWSRFCSSLSANGHVNNIIALSAQTVHARKASASSDRTACRPIPFTVRSSWLSSCTHQSRRGASLLQQIVIDWKLSSVEKFAPVSVPPVSHGKGCAVQLVIVECRSQYRFKPLTDIRQWWVLSLWSDSSDRTPVQSRRPSVAESYHVSDFTRSEAIVVSV